jgi:GntR family transcriptional repressor for pyruvate dehydrogenase complex
LLETQSVKRAAERAVEEQIKELRDLIDFSVAEDESNPVELGENDLTFNLLLAEISGNSVLMRIMYNLIGLLKESREKSMQIPGRALKSLEEHAEIVKAISQQDSAQAEKCMLTHLDSVEQSFIKRIEQEKQG